MKTFKIGDKVISNWRYTQGRTGVVLKVSGNVVRLRYDCNGLEDLMNTCWLDVLDPESWTSIKKGNTLSKLTTTKATVEITFTSDHPLSYNASRLRELLQKSVDECKAYIGNSVSNYDKVEFITHPNAGPEYEHIFVSENPLPTPKPLEVGTVVKVIGSQKDLSQYHISLEALGKYGRIKLLSALQLPRHHLNLGLRSYEVVFNSPVSGRQEWFIPDGLLEVLP